MKSSLIFLVSAGVVIYLQQGVFSKPSPLTIRNGEDAEDGEFPYMVEIRTADNCFYCGGSIIAAKWVLTAGHCIDEESIGQSGNYSIVYGTRDLYDCSAQDDEPDTVIKVKTLHRHFDWSMSFLSGNPSNDIGLLELEENIPFSAIAQPINLTEEDDDSPIGLLGNLTGWGSAIANGAPVPILQKLQLPVLANEECAARIDNVENGDGVVFNGTDTFCTDDQSNGSCKGDSGSPYVINGTQYGIVSWSIKPCGDYPGVFSRVALSAHRRWIKDVTGV